MPPQGRSVMNFMAENNANVLSSPCNIPDPTPSSHIWAGVKKKPKNMIIIMMGLYWLDMAQGGHHQKM